MKKGILKVHNWDRWQSYRSDRGAPPWIKVHRNLMTNAEWSMLSDAEKGQLLSIWIVAADKGGNVTADPKILKKFCQLDEEPNINKFIELGFLVSPCQPDDATVTSCSQGSDAPEENRSDKEKTLSASDAAVLNQEECYKTKKGRTLKGQTLIDFNLFWKQYAYSRGKAEAADAWLNVYSPAILENILEGARKEAQRRPALKAKGKTPKMAQGWLSGRRWEDWVDSSVDDSCDCGSCDYRRRGDCDQTRTVCKSYTPVN